MNNDSHADDSPALHLQKFTPGEANPNDTGLTTLIKRSAVEVSATNPQPVLLPKNGGALPPADLLGALTYCYSHEVYDSEDIQRRMMKERSLREAVHGEVPTANAIRRFRRLNRDAIQRTLEHAFRYMRRKQKEVAQASAAADPNMPMPADSETTATFIRRESLQRLNDAAFVDNMSKE